MTGPALLAGVVALVLFCPPARADGDPASDVLTTTSVFLPYPPPGAAAQAGLAAQVRAVYRQAFRIKVAVIATPQDLGAIPSLFGHPAEYARFLGTELQFLYRGPLLIVMPGGFGIYDDGHPTAAADRALTSVTIAGSSADALTTAAAAAIGRLLQVHAFGPPDRSKPTGTAIGGSALPGGKGRLRYRVWDDSGYARVTLTLTNSHGAHVTELRTGLRLLARGTVYSAYWLLPQRLQPQTLRYCLVATDAAGNRSRPSCARFVVRGGR